MARNREFNPEAILDAALSLFWRKGYKNCCIADVVKKSGVARYGLYQAFKDKDKLYYAALTHYQYKIRKRFITPFCNTDKKADFSTIVSLFDLLIEQTDEGMYDGCFVHQAAIERGGVDQEVDEIVQSFFAETKEGYRIAIRNGIELGQIRDLPLDDLVLYVMGIHRALIAMLKQSCTTQECRDYIRCALTLLQPESSTYSIKGKINENAVT